MGYRPQQKCVHIAGDHCIKIGGKCVELRFFSHVCQMKQCVPFTRPKPPSSPKPPAVQCARCPRKFGECKHQYMVKDS